MNDILNRPLGCSRGDPPSQKIATEGRQGGSKELGTMTNRYESESRGQRARFVDMS
jgi:hypothetical protein